MKVTQGKSIFCAAIVGGIFYSASIEAGMREIAQLVQDVASVCSAEDRDSEQCKRLSKAAKHIRDSINCDSPSDWAGKDDKELSEVIASGVRNLSEYDPILIVGLVTCIEGMKEDVQNQCRKNSSKREFSCVLPRGDSKYTPLGTPSSKEGSSAAFEKVRFELVGDQCERIIIRPANKNLGQGGFKTYDLAFEYKTWAALGRGKVREDKAKKGETLDPRENANLAQVNGLPGVIRTLYTSDQVIVQDYYKTPLDKARDLTPGTAIQAFAQLSLGVHGIHDRGLVHSDLKPANMLIHEDGRAVITDLGGAVTAGQKETVFTKYYRAPELFKGRPKIPTEKSDVYSLGLSFHEILRGSIDKRLLGRCPDPEHATPECVEQSVASIRDELLNSNDPLKKLIGSTLHQDPNLRPGIVEFRKQLDSIMRDKITAIHPGAMKALPANIEQAIQNSDGMIVYPIQDDRAVAPPAQPGDGKYHLMVAFRGPNGKIERRSLDGNPADPGDKARIQQQIESIKSRTGTGPVQLASKNDLNQIQPGTSVTVQSKAGNTYTFSYQGQDKGNILAKDSNGKDIQLRISRLNLTENSSQSPAINPGAPLPVPPSAPVVSPAPAAPVSAAPQVGSSEWLQPNILWNQIPENTHFRVTSKSGKVYRGEYLQVIGNNILYRDENGQEVFLKQNRLNLNSFQIKQPVASPKPPSELPKIARGTVIEIQSLRGNTYKGRYYGLAGGNILFQTEDGEEVLLTPSKLDMKTLKIVSPPVPGSEN